MISKKFSLSKNSELFQDTWELAAEELLNPKEKLNYTDKELIRLKKLLIVSPPPIKYRKIVRKKLKLVIIINLNYKIVMAQNIRCCSRKRK